MHASFMPFAFLLIYQQLLLAIKLFRHDSPFFWLSNSLAMPTFFHQGGFMAQKNGRPAANTSTASNFFPQTGRLIDDIIHRLSHFSDLFFHQPAENAPAWQ